MSSNEMIYKSYKKIEKRKWMKVKINRNLKKVCEFFNQFVTKRGDSKSKLLYRIQFNYCLITNLIGSCYQLKIL